MKEATALIQELAALTGADVTLSPDGVAALVADGNALSLRWREEDQDWLCYGVVLDGGAEPLARDVRRRPDGIRRKSTCGAALSEAENENCMRKDFTRGRQSGQGNRPGGRESRRETWEGQKKKDLRGSRTEWVVG